MQVEYKTEKGVLRFKLLPIETTSYNDSDYKGYLSIYLEGGVSVDRIKLYDGEQLIGLTSDVSEEQAKMMVDDSGLNELLGETYKDYTATYVFDTALESLKSLMQLLQMYEANPYEKPEYPEDNGYTDDKGAFEYKIGVYNYYMEEWQKAQSRTGKWIVLFKEIKGLKQPLILSS